MPNEGVRGSKLKVQRPRENTPSGKGWWVGVER